MDHTVEVLTVLAGLSVVLVAVYASWMLNLHRDLKVGKRVRLKLKDLSLPKKLYGVALVGYLVFVLYFEMSTIIRIMTGTGVAFPAELQDAVTSIWLGAVGLLGIGLLYSLRSPVRKTTV